MLSRVGSLVRINQGPCQQQRQHNISSKLAYGGYSSDSDFGYSSSSYGHSRAESSAGLQDASRKKKNVDRSLSSTTPSPPTTASSRSRSYSPTLPPSTVGSNGSEIAEKNLGAKETWRQERTNKNGGYNIEHQRQAGDSRSVLRELEEVARRSMPEILSAVDNMMALFSPRKTLMRTPIGRCHLPGDQRPPAVPLHRPAVFEQRETILPDIEKPRRRRRSPVRFEFHQNRLPLSPPLVWWTKEGHRQPQDEVTGRVPASINEQDSMTQFFQTSPRLPPSQIPKLPKLGSVDRKPEAPRERLQAEKIQHCPPLTRLDKLTSLCRNPIRQQDVSPRKEVRDTGYSPDVGACALPPDPQQPHLPHFMLSEPMRFRPVFIKPSKPSPVPSQLFSTIPVPNPTVIGAHGKQRKKELPSHLRFGNFNIRRNDRRPPVELTSARNTREVKARNMRDAGYPQGFSPRRFR